MDGATHGAVNGTPFTSRATKPAARHEPVPSGCCKARRSLCRVPWLRIADTTCVALRAIIRALQQRIIQSLLKQVLSPLILTKRPSIRLGWFMGKIDR